MRQVDRRRELKRAVAMVMLTVIFLSALIFFAGYLTSVPEVVNQ